MQQTTQELKSEINVTPLVDVVLVLLIIFMVVTPMIVSRNVELPDTSHPSATDTAAHKTVYLTAAGDLFFEDVPVVPEVLIHRLSELQARSPEIRILLHADRRLRYQQVMKILDLISKSGFSQIGLIAQPQS